MNVCKSYKLIPYESKYLEDLSYQVMKFQQKAGTEYFKSEIKYRTPSQKFTFFKARIKELIDRSQYNTLAIDEESNKIFAFWSFRIENGVCRIPFIFKSEEFKMNTTMFEASYEAFGSMKLLGFNEVHTILSRKQKDLKKYLNFLNRYYNLTIKHGDEITAIFHI